MSLHEPEQRRRPPKIVSYGLLTLGGVAVIAPVILLYRANPNRIGLKKLKLRTNAPPPVRRTASTIKTDSVKLSDISFSPRSVLRAVDEDEVVPVGQGPGPLHALKAFGIATCVVGAVAIASVLSLRSILGVETPEQFAQLMRQKLAILAPSLLSKIHRDPSETDSIPISSLHGSTLRTATTDSSGPKGPRDVKDVNSLDWLRDIEEQLEKEAAAEREERRLRKRS